MDILDRIIAYKSPLVEEKKREIPIQELEKSPFFDRNTFSFPEYILVKTPGIIAEFKRKSPSKPFINPAASPVAIIPEYEKAGAAAISVLTDEYFFGGNKQDIISIRNAISVPILRKDFIFDEYQVIEAKSIGADAILLIASILSKVQIKKLASLANSLGLSVLMEIHQKEELSKLCEGIDVVGVNNRNLKSFEVSLDNSLELVEEIPAEFVKISESGIRNPEDIEILTQAGFNGFLIGESLMKNKKPGEELQKWIKYFV
jgi:indole-3-glycerol phosphate synthase